MPRTGVTDRLHDLADTARTLSQSCGTLKAINRLNKLVAWGLVERRGNHKEIEWRRI